MAIQSGDVRLVKSKVMLDVPEGGGGPTGTVIADGVSNDMFPDVSATDRVNGRLNARQVHLHVNTPTQDMYLGANVIVSRPPNDANISITLLDTGQAFDTRTDAISRVESYLYVGANWPGVLFGNHLAGMQVISIVQRTGLGPAIGDTLVLTKREGYTDQYQQYIRVMAVSTREQEFEDNKGPFTRFVLELTLSDPLRADFGGFEGAREDVTVDNLRLRTKISKSVVANASRYYGVAELAQPLNIGDSVARLDSIFTQLVPSAQVETPLLDARTNQTSATNVSVGAVVTDRFPLTFAWDAGRPTLYVGAGITPGTLKLNYPYWSQTTDDGLGAMIKDGVVQGTVDYDNGILRYTAGNTMYPRHDTVHDNWLSIEYAPRTSLEAVTQNQGLPVTAGNRSLNLVRTLTSIPVAGTLAVDYRAQGNWYTLQDNGRAELRGTDPAFGAGTLNRQTGTMAVTFGALPDVGSAIMVRWADPATEIQNAMLSVVNSGKVFIEGNADGLLSAAKASRSFAPGAVTITWNDGTARTVTDNGSGALQGYGTGVINYAEGWFRLSPTTLPPKGTMLMIAGNTRVMTSKNCPMGGSGGNATISVGETIAEGSLSFYLQTQRKFKFKGGALTNFGDLESYLITDDGLGKVFLTLGGIYDTGVATKVQVGTVNYATGLITLSATTLTAAQARINTRFDNMFWLQYVYPLYDTASGPTIG